MPKTKVEVYDKDHLIYPFIESDHVTFSNGMKVSEMLDQSISMPTVTHEDLSFKVGVGDQDVSSAIVDSSVAEMTIKGKTYQNILPEPSTHVLTNNKEMFKVNEGLDPNVEIVDGIAKHAVLSGQTLVNLVQQKNMYQLFGTSGQGKVNRTITTSGMIYETSVGDLNSYITVRTKAHPLIKPNTSYTIFFEVVQNTITKNGVDYKGVTVSGYDDSYYGRSGDRQLYHDGNFSLSKGLKKIVITTPSSVASYDGLGFGFPSFAANETPQGQVFEIQNVMIIEGDYTNVDIPYFEGMASCKMPVLTTTGKNLWSGESITIGSYVDAQGVLTAANTDFLSDFIEVKPNTTYAFKVMDSRATTPYGVKSLYDKNKKFISRGNGVHSNNVPFTTPNNCHYVRIHGNSYTQCGNTIPDCMLIETASNPSTITTHEPYKLNILHTPEEVVLRSLPNGVKDTLNLNTGEYVQRIGEITFNGSETWYESGSVAPNNYCAFARVQGSKNALSYNIVCNSLPVRNILSATIDYEGCMFNEWSSGDKANIVIKIANSKLSSTSVEGIKAYLQSNPITVQYELATPVMKTVDLSSSGNWEKVVLNGSENWTQSTTNNNHFMETSVIKSNYNTGTENLVFSGDYRLSVAKIYTSNTNTGLCIEKGGGLRIRTQQVLKGQSIEDFKAYLSQNPVMVYYQTKNHQDSTQVKQPIFFKDGHIIQSSGADNSLIPTLDYQAKTSNSYVMDLMKTNTKYTMKAKTASGTFTIDGTSYGAGTNGTFTTPSSMTNKFLVMSNKTNEEIMILEGDLTSKTIPYFKGIKSTFEDESKIEVLSTNHNLWIGIDNYTNSGATIILKDKNECVFEHHAVNNGIKVKVSDYEYQVITMSYDFEILDGKALNVGGHNRHQTKAYYIDGINVGTSYHNGHVTTYEKNRVYHVDHVVHINLPIAGGANGDREYIGIEPNRYSADTPTYCKMRVTNFQIALGNVIKEYEPPKSNSTKIPLLSPLRSLPNGICDELIIDRMKNKATLIQRVYEIVLNDKHLGTGNNPDGNLTFMGRWYFDRLGIPRTVYNGTGCINANKMPIIPYGNNIWVGDSEGITIQDYQNQIIDIRVSKSKLSQPNHNGLLKWANDNPIIFQYELETPIITEVDLEGFPYIYKDGHIFLNSEIVPITEITYSINQCQQISASNEDIIRHEKELTYLQKLIAQYVKVDYESALLSLKV